MAPLTSTDLMIFTQFFGHSYVFAAYPTSSTIGSAVSILIGEFSVYLPPPPHFLRKKQARFGFAAVRRAYLATYFFVFVLKNPWLCCLAGGGCSLFVVILQQYKMKPPRR